MSWRGTLPPACWESTEALRIIPTEAESPSDGVFVATHSPVPVFIRDVIGNAGEGTRTTEEALLRAVAEQPADQPILPILGGSGTGKSHLVRWLRTVLPKEPTRRVIFVPKHHTSLRQILNLILDHAGGERAADLRKKVAAATEGFADAEVAKLRLRNELALLVETQGNTYEGSDQEQDLRGYLASREGLPALLGDDIFRDALLNENGPITRLVLEKLHGKGAEDKDEAFGFTPDNLNLSVDDVSRAGSAAKSVAASLVSEPQLRKVAADMLNEQLGPAVSQVFGIGGDDLKDLLVDVRSEYKKQGLELLLLIEDFSIFQGVQGGLLDAITLIPTQGNDICPMRVVMAVTTGYFRNQMPDTVYTRVYKIFDLDDPKPGVSFSPKELAARYLNAIRVGAQALETAYTTNGEISNACEQCPVNDACHKAFGAVNGFGLFPFNEHALDKAVKSKAVEDRLSVRDFLTRVLRPVMFNDQHNIDAGRFPSERFDSDFRAGARGTLDSVEDEHQLATQGDIETSRRRVSLVRYFGPEGSGPRNLNHTIHTAFAVPPLEGLPGTAVTDDGEVHTSHIPAINPPSLLPTNPVVSPPSIPRTNPASVPALVQAIDAWRASGAIKQGPRNDLRNIVHTAVTARLMLDDGLGGSRMWTKLAKPWDTAFDAARSIKIGEDLQAAQALITIDSSDTTAVRALRALAWVNATGNWNTVERGDELQVLVEEQISAWAATVSSALLPYRDNRDDTELIATARALLAQSKALGIPEAFKDDSLSRMRAIFIPASVSETLPRYKLRSWQQRVAPTTESSRRLSREQLQQRVLRLASFAQGAGAPLAVDVPRIAKALRGKEIPMKPFPSSGLLTETVTSIEAFHGALPELLEEAKEKVPNLDGLGGDLREVINNLQGLILERAPIGQVPTAIDQPALRLAGDAITQGDQACSASVGEDLGKWDTLTLDQKLRVLTANWDESVERVHRWYVLATRALQLMEIKLGSGVGSVAQLEYDQARSALLDTLDELSGLLQVLATTEVPE